MSRNRERLFKTKRLRKDSRTIPLPGNGVGEADENGQYFKCWNCGFTCDRERDELGGSDSRDGLSYENYSVDTFGGTPGLSGLATLGGDIEHFQVALKLDSSGSPIEPEKNIRAVAGTGCPFCGCRNWRGDY